MRLLLTSIFLTLFLQDIEAQCPITVNAGDDIYLCAPPSPTQLDGDVNGIYFGLLWTPSQGLSSTTILNPTAIVTQTTSYALTANSVDFNANVLSNSDFEGGNTGFTSDYIYNPGNLVPEGFYDVIPDPSLDHPNFAACNDHTSGSGNMMVVNGAGTPNQDVWCQTVNVMPNTFYILSAWVTTVVASSPALLQFSINGTTIGPIFNAPSQTCVWQNFYQSWNSGAATSATICIVNQNTVLGGNDFALDDIVFAPVCKVTDTVTVHVINVTAAASPAISIIPCNGANVTLSGTGSSTGANITYQWDTPNGNIVSGATTLNPVVNAAGIYTLTVTYEENGHSCEKTATVSVIESTNPLAAWITPPQPIGCGGTTTTLLGNSNQPGASTYQWSTTNGNIVSGQNQKNCVVSLAGIYTLLVTNTTTGCTATAEVTVTTANNPPTANATGGVINCLQPQITVSGAGSSTGANINYSWSAFNGGTLSGATNGLNATATTGGSYVLAVTNTSNGCITRDTVVVPAQTAHPIISASSTGILDCDTDTISVSVSINPATAHAHWTTVTGHIASGVDSTVAQVTLAGVYTVAVTDPSNGCSTTATVTVSSDYGQPTALIAPPPTITCQSPSPALNALGSSVGSNFIYSWTVGNGGNIVMDGNTLNPTINAAGTYTLVVHNTSNGCTASASVAVLADNNVVSAVANVPDTLDCTLNILMLNSTGSTTGAGITYQWSTGDGMIFLGADTPTPLVVSGGTYTLVVSNSNTGCSATDLAVVVQDNHVPILQIPQINPISCHNAPVTLTGQNLSLPGNFTYQWTPTNGGNIFSGSTTLTPLITSSGIYTLLATNQVNGCKASVSAAVSIQDATPLAVASVSGPITCASPAVNLLTTGSSTGANISYNWSPAPASGVSISSPGVYVLTVTNTDNGCTTTASISVQEDKAIPSAEAGPADTITCASAQVLLVANAGQNNSNLQFSWSHSNGTLIQNDSALVNAQGIYHLEVKNILNGCIAYDSVPVSINQILPGLSIADPDTLNCLLSQATLSASGSGNQLSWQWQTFGGNILSGPNTSAPIVNAAGIYSVVLTDGGNGCKNNFSLEVVMDTLKPKMFIGALAPITCKDSLETINAVPLSPGAMLTYQWTASNGGQVVPPGNSASITVKTGGTYSLHTYNPANGCSADISVNLLQDTQLPTVNAGLDDTISCTVSQLNLAASAGGAPSLFYQWTASGGGQIIGNGNTTAPTISKAGIYQLLVTNPTNGCTSTDAVQIFADLNTPQAAAGNPDTLTCSIKDLTLQGSASIGANFSYNWTTLNGGNIALNGNTLSPTVDHSGLYVLSVKNATNGCITTDTVAIAADTAPPMVNAGADATLTCAVKQLELSAIASGGNTLLFNWNSTNGQIQSGAQTLKPIVTSSGDYSLTVTNDDNGCTATDILSIVYDTISPVLSFANPAKLDCDTHQISLSAQVSSPANNFTPNWTTSGTGHLVSGQNSLAPLLDKPGSYVLEVKNNLNGCVSNISVPVIEDITKPAAAAAAPDAVTCTVSSVALNGTGSSVGANFTYSWAGPSLLQNATTLTPTVGASGIYTLTVLNTDNACTATSAATVMADTLRPNVSIAQPADLSCIYKQLTINAFVPGSAGNFTVNWTTSPGGNILSGATTLTPVIDKPGDYTVLVQDKNNGCSATAQVLIKLNLEPPGAEAGNPAFLHCNKTQVPLQGSSPTGNAQYNWSFNQQSIANAASYTADKAGVYLLTVTHPINGCTSTDSVLVEQIEPPVFDAILTLPTCKTPTGSIDFGVVSGGSEPYQFSVKGGAMFQSNPIFKNLAVGDYSLVAQDANGCTSTATESLPAFGGPSLSLPPFYSIVLGDSIQLKPQTNVPDINIASWSWKADPSLSCTGCEIPWAKPKLSTNYFLTLVDDEGCKATAITQVRVDRRLKFYAPNIFSPNGDNDNDRFTLYGPRITKIHSLDIFDRWGNLVFRNTDFEADDESSGWDGTFKGSLMNPAVFVWQARLEFFDGTIEVFYGDVTLKR